MVNEKLRERLLSLFTRIRTGDLSEGGDVSRQMFISTLDVLISEEKRELEMRISNLEETIKKLKTEKDER